MLLYLAVLILYTFIIASSGFSFLSLVESIGEKRPNLSLVHTKGLSIYFTGFSILSILTFYLSISISINQFLIFAYFSFSTMGLVFFRKKLMNYLSFVKKLTIIDTLAIAFISIFIVSISNIGIFNYDSGLYHIQSIKWIREYPVVYGLGNLHSRFAYNSMFFPISSIFSINEIFGGREILLYPLNTISFVVFLIWQYFNLKSEIADKNPKGIAFISTVVFLCLYFFAKQTSSPSPDIICAIIIITVFQLAAIPKRQVNHLSVLVTTLIFVCIACKLSSALLCLLLLLFIRRERWVKDLLQMSILGTIVMLPFFIRNYYLSGYLLYPFSSGIDLFHVDWKIPMNLVIYEESRIESWAKIPFKHYSEVLDLSLREWVPDWFQRQFFLVKLILCIILSTPLFSLALLIKKRYFDFKITIILSLNLLFWFVKSPDPRFAFGFLFFLTAYILYLAIDLIRIKILHFFIFLIPLLTSKNIIMLSHETLVQHYYNPNLFINPKGFTLSVEQMQVEKKVGTFEFYQPVSDDRCFNSKLPCTPYPDDNLVLRGQNIQQGFRFKKSNLDKK